MASNQAVECVQALVRANPDAGKPPSKRRKLRQLEPAQLVDQRRLTTKRYTDTMRHAMADLVHQYLQPGTEERALADAERAHLIDFAQYRRRNKQSPIAAADRDMCARYPESFATRAVSTRHEALRKWFVHIRSPRHAGGGDGSARDLPRIAQPGKNLQREDWEFCRHALLYWRWQDEAGRKRRHPGLQHALDMKREARDAQAQSDADKLADIYKRSKCRGWENFTACVMSHFSLSWATEQFHEPRTTAPHYTHAKRYLSKAPVIEYYRSKRADPQDASYRDKVVKVRQRNPAYKAVSSSVQRKARQRGEPPPSVVPAAQEPTRSLPCEIEQDFSRRGEPKWLDHVMLYDDSKEQITASVDGFSVWMQPDDTSVGHRVCVAEGEQLPTLSRPKQVGKKKQDKNYYMCITLPGYGVLDTALMKSGSKERSGTERGGSKYWYRRIVEQKLNYEGCTNAKQLRRELEDRLAESTWKVRTLFTLLHALTACREATTYHGVHAIKSICSCSSISDSALHSHRRMLLMPLRRSSASLSLSRCSCSNIATTRSVPN